MSRWSTARAIGAILLLLGIAATTACDGVQNQTAPSPNLPSPQTAVKGKNRVYISARTAVLIYKYAQDYFLGKLTGMQDARGLCTDAANDVYVTNFESADVLEFAVGDSNARQINDVSPYPIDCAVDRSSGSLAVVNEYGESEYSTGNVAIYKDGKGDPKVYRYSTFSSFDSCAFDARGDLLVSGMTSSRSPAFAYLASGGKSLQPVALQTSGSGPSYVRWDGRYFVVEFADENDESLNFVQYVIGKGSGTQKKTMSERVPYGTAPFWVGRIGKSAKQGAANALAAVTEDGTYFWKYPAGTLVDHLYYNDYTSGITVTGEE